jgi:hypothetical protein
LKGGHPKCVKRVEVPKQSPSSVLIVRVLERWKKPVQTVLERVNSKKRKETKNHD